ncbi:hypothetical protein J3459_017627 [Metarhizium acridum]|uniref:uncharacterized protein n=1 Tax=Metarhizium acridum TaxID=92637 RepID=UPI001C6C61AC|nr:hypothetical protein J3459_017627 [Metarhizium acridum]KAG8411081.1 hypothetical protein J3458_016192 [Metarhizium acridum]
MSIPFRWHVLNYETRFLDCASNLAVIDDATICLDRRLRDSPDIKELAMFMLSTLQQALKLAISRHPLVKTVVNDDVAMLGVTGAVSRLEQLVPIIRMRESPLAREAMEVRRLITKEWREGRAALVSR